MKKKNLWEIESDQERKWLFGMDCVVKDKNGKPLYVDMEKAHKLGFDNKFNKNRYDKELPDCPICNTNKYVKKFIDTDGIHYGYLCGRCGRYGYKDKW